MFITNTSNWPSFWPGYVGLEEGSRWIKDFEPNRLVTYTSAQKGLPDAFHERHFESDGEGFVYRLVVEYAPRAGINGVLDRILLPRGIRRAFERTFVALDKLLSWASRRGQRGFAAPRPVLAPMWARLAQVRL